MKQAAIVTIAAMAIAAAGIGTVTAVMQTDSPHLAPEASVATRPESESTTSADPEEVSQAEESPSLSQTSPENAQTEERLTAAEYERLRDFPHQPIQVTDEVPVGSEFADFREEIRQAVRDRNRDFIRPLLPMSEHGLAIGFGFSSLEEVGFDESDGWIWSMLEKTMALGCGSKDAADYGYPEAESSVWVCPNITLAFEAQYPAPSDAQGIDHYVDHVMVIGENVNVRTEPSTEGEVIALLSNEVVETDPAGWEVLYQRLGDSRPDPINGWTPVQLPNSKSGFVYSRYAYAPLDPRLVFAKMDGQWKIVRIQAGD